MAKVVCIDSHILFWGVKEEATEGQEFMIPRAKKLLEQLKKSGAVVIVPSVSLGEFLVKIPPEDHPTILQQFQRRFRVIPYDVPATSFTARIRRLIQPAEIRAELPDYVRDNITPDCQILGVAISRHAEVIYTEDEGIIKISAKQEVIEISKGFAKARHIPEYDTAQLTLENDLNEGDETS
jgi:hypothetical protein